MPAWRQGMAVGEWRQIPNSALSSAPITVRSAGNTGPESKIIAWNSFAIDTRDSTVYSPANGGHHDYAGNEVNSIRLSDDAPLWIERRAATSGNQVVENTTHYADGRPTSRHTFYGAVCNEVRNRVMVISGSRWGNGWVTSATDGFNLSSNDWDLARTYPDVPSAAVALAATAFVEHKVSGDIYAFGNYGVFRWLNASNTWSQVVSNSTIYGFGAAAALDTRRNRILVVGGSAAFDHGVYTLGANTTQNVSFTGPAAGAMPNVGNGSGMVYEPWLDAFLVRLSGAGGTVYRIDAQTFAVDTLPTSGGSAVPNAINGVWRRFLFAPKLGGIVYAPAYSSNMWFLRTT
jgi:hypothetical protein